MTRKAAQFLLALVCFVAWSLVATAAVRDGRLGSSCDDDRPCAADLICLDEEGGAETLMALNAGSCVAAFACLEPGDELLSEGGPAGGVCSAPCQYDEECWVHTPDSSCWYDGFCHETCTLGAPAAAGLDGDKCHGRSDMACICDLFVGCEHMVCTPLCASDADCASGFFCHQGTGLCHASKPKDLLRYGAQCSGPGDPACSGICDLDVITSTVGSELIMRCERPCVFGAEDACPVAEAGRKSACISRFALLASSVADAPGDVARCTDLCDCDSDCSEGHVCDPWDLGGRFDAAGVCLGGEREPDAPSCIDGVGGTGGAPSDCEYGSVRACKASGCLGTAVCLPDGSYSTCECLAGEAGAGGGGADDAPRAPVVVEDSGCGCRAAGFGEANGRGSLLLLALLFGVRLSSGRRARRRSSRASFRESVN